MNPISLLRDLVAAKPISHTSNAELVRIVADVCASYGIEHTIDWSADQKNANIIARIGPEAPGGVLLTAHTDVVPAGDGWTSDPWTLQERDGFLIGRGALDNLGAVACFLSALSHWTHAHVVKPIYIVLTHSEEPNTEGFRSNGVHSALAVLDNWHSTPEVCIVGMPTNMQVVAGHNTQVVGAKIAVNATGGFGFSANDRAITNALDIASILQAHMYRATSEIQKTLGGGSITVLKIEAPVHPVRFPSSCSLFFDIRCKPGMSQEDVVHVMQKTADEALATYRQEKTGVSDVVCTALGMNQGFVCTNVDSVRLVNTWAGNAPDAHGIVIHYVTEAAHFARYGSVVVCGPGNLMGNQEKGIGGAHAPNEGIAIAQIEAYTHMLDRIGKYCCLLP